MIAQVAYAYTTLVMAARIGEALAMENQSVARADTSAIEATIMRFIAGRDQGKTLDPQEVARELAGPHPDQWGPLMQPIRRVAVALAEQGRARDPAQGQAGRSARLQGRLSARARRGMD